MSDLEYCRLTTVYVHGVPEERYLELSHLVSDLLKIEKSEDGTHSVEGAVVEFPRYPDAEPWSFENLSDALPRLLAHDWQMVTHTLSPQFYGIEVFYLKRDAKEGAKKDRVMERKYKSAENARQRKADGSSDSESEETMEIKKNLLRGSVAKRKSPY